MESTESSTLEFKEAISKSFLKTVSAYANFGTGRIVFGIDDDGNAVGLNDSDATRLSIENAINDALEPRPEYYLETIDVDSKRCVELTVLEGPDKPYLASGKAYRRIDTSTAPVDRSELRRLAIEGSQREFDDMDSSDQNLTFSVLGTALESRFGIKKPSKEILRTLGLLHGDTYSNAAALLADSNSFPGVDIVRYSDDEKGFHERVTKEGESVLAQLDEALDMYKRNYVVEEVQGMARAKRELIPKEAFREAVANALVHRVWYTTSHTVISFYHDRIEIVSPGGLPMDITQEMYLEGGISVPRNATLAYVFLRLGLIERLGTGIKTIKGAYSDSLSKPTFQIGDRAIRVILPVTSSADSLENDERRVLECFLPGLEIASIQIEEQTGLSRSSVLRILDFLMEKGAISRIGGGRSTRYRLS